MQYSEIEFSPQRKKLVILLEDDFIHVIDENNTNEVIFSIEDIEANEHIEEELAGLIYEYNNMLDDNTAEVFLEEILEQYNNYFEEEIEV